MNRSRIAFLGTTAFAFGIILGCDSGAGTGTLDNGFTGDGSTPVGGTGGTGTIGGGTSGGTVVTGADDVELPAEETRSFFTAFQIDPVEEDTAGPKFVVAGDVDQDGLMDLVSAWNQSQPIQLHLQRRDPDGVISFRTITLAGTSPIAVVAGLELGQINDDGMLDVVVLAKANGNIGLCPGNPPSEISTLVGEIIVFFSPGTAALIPDGDRWTRMILVNPLVADRWIHNQFPGMQTGSFQESQTKPEHAGFTSLAVGDMDNDGADDIVVALNPGSCKELGQDPPVNSVDIWMNPGGTLSEDDTLWGIPADITLSRNVPLSVFPRSGSEITDVVLSDVEGDGDLDIVVAESNAISRNLSWYRNPFVPHQPLGLGGLSELTAGSTCCGDDVCAGGLNDEGFCPNGDADCLGVSDGTCAGGICIGGVSPGSSCTGNAGCAGVSDGRCIGLSWRFTASGWQNRPVGQVDTNSDVLVIGDIDLDGFDDVVVRSTPGEIIQWFRKPNSLVIEPEFPPNDPIPDRTDFPWPVFTLTEFTGQEPEAVAIGDLTGDGFNEVIVAVEGGVFWFDSTVGLSVFDPWFPTTIIQDTPADSTDATQASGSAPGSGVGIAGTDASTVINSLLIVDLDGDGKNDIVGTLDRRTNAGLSDDRLVWYRNTRQDP